MKHLIERDGPNGKWWYAEKSPGGWTSDWRQADLFDVAYARCLASEYRDASAKPLYEVEAENARCGL